MNIEIRIPKNETQIYSICIGRGDQSGNGGISFSQTGRFSIILEDHDNKDDPREVTYATMIFATDSFARKISWNVSKMIAWFTGEK